MNDAADNAADLPGLVMRSAHRVRRARMAALEPYGLSPHQAQAFFGVARHQHHGGGAELRLSNLAQWLRVAPRSVTEVVDALCEKGLVERVTSPTDRRATMVVLTPAGEQLNDELSTRQESIPEMFAPLTTAEQQQLAHLLRKLQDDEPCHDDHGRRH